MKKLIIIFSFLLLVVSACGTNSSEDSSTDGKLVIYTSVYPLEFLASQIAGDLASVKSVYPPGVDAHTYEPSSKEITNIARSDAFIYLGAGMESFSESIVESLSSHDVLFIEVGENEQLFLHANDDEHNHDDHHHGDFDPHIWLDPLRMIKVGELITSNLSELDPDNRDTFKSNFAHLKEKLQSLDEQFVQTLKQKQSRKIIVSHAAYGYWEERYGIEQIPISGLSSSDEPSQKELANIAKLAKKEQLNYVIFEQTGSNRLAEVIQENIEAEKLYIHNLEVLTDENIENGEDYFSIMEQNLQTLDKALK